MDDNINDLDELYQLSSSTSTQQINTIKKKAAVEVGMSDPKKVIGSALHGINFLNTGINASNNIDLQGITFFTRPFLNLNEANISSNRKLAGLLTKTQHSISYSIRRLLDVKLLMDNENNLNGSALMDEYQAFIPIFTNLLTGISGWPDETMEVYVAEPGIRNETYMLVDDSPNEYSAFDVTATFRNIDGDPINAILTVWLAYAKGVSIGSLIPYPEMIINRIIDYQTRIYRLVLDTSRRWIHKLACCGAATPIANPLGTSFNYTVETPLAVDTMQQNVPFKAIGYAYNDPIIIRDFNTTVGRFNPKMKDAVRNDLMLKIPPPLHVYFNYRCYPRISENMELEWWCSKVIFSNVVNLLALNVDEEWCLNWFDVNRDF